MAIERRIPPEGKGRNLYEVLRARLSKLAAGDQIALGFALQRGSPFAALSPATREAFDELAEDLDL